MPSNPFNTNNTLGVINGASHGPSSVFMSDFTENFSVSYEVHYIGLSNAKYLDTYGIQQCQVFMPAIIET